MFGHNQIVGRPFFQILKTDELFITSIFLTLQGEGPLAGKAAMFVRFAFCNLQCSFCDTFFDAGDKMTHTEVIKKMYEVASEYFRSRNRKPSKWVNSLKHELPLEVNEKGIVLVITGGEPLLQPNLAAFVARVSPLFDNVQIETNGIPVNEVLSDDYRHVTIVCSPKCAEKDGKPTRYLKPSKHILDRANCLKFVMSSDPQSPYHVIPDWALDLADKIPIYVSPMNVYNDIPYQAKMLRAKKGEITLAERSTIDEVVDFWTPGLLNLKAIEQNHKYAARYALDHNLRLNMQMHLFAGLA